MIPFVQAQQQAAGTASGYEPPRNSIASCAVCGHPRGSIASYLPHSTRGIFITRAIKNGARLEISGKPLDTTIWRRPQLFAAY